MKLDDVKVYLTDLENEIVDKDFKISEMSEQMWFWIFAKMTAFLTFGLDIEMAPVNNLYNEIKDFDIVQIW